VPTGRQGIKWTWNSAPRFTRTTTCANRAMIQNSSIFLPPTEHQTWPSMRDFNKFPAGYIFMNF
jgi:hypothetical protein